MAAPVMPAADTLTRTLLAAYQADWGEWAPGDLLRVAVRLGWSVVDPPDGARPRVDTGISGLDGRWQPDGETDGCPVLRFEAVAPPVPPTQPAPAGYAHTAPGYAPGWGPGGYVRDRGRELDAAHARLVAAISAVVGPAPWRGGPNAWLRWRGQRTTLQVGRVPDPGLLYMELFPTARGDAREHAAFARGTGAALPYDWCVSRPDLALGELFLPLGPPAATWSEFAVRLPSVVSSLVTDLPLVGWGEPVLLVVCDDARPGHAVELRAGQDRLELGLTPGAGNRVWLRPAGVHAVEAAQVILHAFAEWDVGEPSRLRVRAWTSGGYLDLPGLGVHPDEDG